MTLPPIKGRWLSRNKETVQVINTKPAFIYPQVPLLDQETQEKEKEGEEEEGRKRKGNGGPRRGGVEALEEEKDGEEERRGKGRRKGYPPQWAVSLPKQPRSSRVRRGSGSHSNNNYVALCGGVFRNLYGIIQSPEYPLYYPNNKVGICLRSLLVIFIFLLSNVSMTSKCLLATR